jgi:hypothetical protein
MRDIQAQRTPRESKGAPVPGLRSEEPATSDEGRRRAQAPGGERDKQSQRAAYDNRASLDEWNLRRIAAEAGGLDGLIELAQTQGRLFCEVAGALPESAAAVLIPVLIISGEELIVDEPWPLAGLVGGIGAIPLPRHAAQLAGLRS